MTTNQKKSLVAFYLSKYNDRALEQLGYGQITQALRDLSEKLRGEGEVNNYIKRRRDEFDVFFDNSRKGLRNRKPARAVLEMYHMWNAISFEQLTEMVKQTVADVYDASVQSEMVKGISDKVIEAYLNFEDENASLVKKFKEVLERKIDIEKINMLKRFYAYRCQICGINVGSAYGVGIAEAHHINYFSESIDNSSDNIMILCPNHHSLIHKLNPKFDFERLQYIYPNGKVDKLTLDLHLAKDMKDD